MTNEQEIFALMQMAKDQQVAVERAVAGLDKLSRELSTVIAQIRTLQANVAEEAKKGAEDGLRGMSSKAISAFDTEVTKAMRLIGEGAETLRVAEWFKSIQWLGGATIWGIFLGVALSWFLWARDTRAAVDRLDAVSQAHEHRLQELDQQQSAQKLSQSGHSTTARKPKPMQQVQALQEQR
jgi:ElaB/YqjD/DUF883 family membrane-anchored ribosome-binding protein